MARPIGRYFASVIAEIRDAKKKENIVIDDSFKLKLRQQLMMKIASQIPSSSRVSWVERLLPFKTYLAVIPALALVIVAVVGISKLPVQLKNNEIVPVSQPQNGSGQNSADNQALTNQSFNNTQSLDNSSTIKTFSAHDALPPNYFSNSSPAPTPVHQLSQPQDAPSANSFNKSSSQVSQPQTSDQSAQNLLSQNPITSQNPGSQPQSNPNLPVEPSTPSSGVTPNFAERMPIPPASTDQISAGSSALQPVTSLSQTAPLPQTDVNSSSSTITPSSTSINLNKIVSDSISTPLNTSVLQTSPSLELNDIATLPATHLHSLVVYYGNFSTDEKTVLEKDLLPYLVGSLDVDSIKIYQQNASTIVITLHQTNGKTITYTYSIDSSGNLSLIKSVQSS